MSDEVPPAQQCTLPSCTDRAVDPQRTGALCQDHLDGLGDDEASTDPDLEKSTVDDELQDNITTDPNGIDKLDSDLSTLEDDPVAGEDDIEIDAAPAIVADSYPAELVATEQWLTWKPTDDGRKIPRAPYEHPDWPDKFVSAQDPDIWTDFETATNWAEKLSGFAPAFNIRDRGEHPDEEYVLIDYDDARDPETGRLHPVGREHIERAGSYADVSTSGTGIHIFCRGELPRGVKAIEASLSECEDFPDAEIEVYDSARYSAMTGHRIASTPEQTTDCQAFLEELADEFATVAEGTPDQLLREPEKSAEEIADVETTDDIQDVFDAIQHTGPRDIRLRSTVTHERGDGSKSLDPSWGQSKSGTRLAQVDDGWVYRKGMHGLDALQVVALEERIIHWETEYPSGEDFWNAVDALRNRGTHIPEYEPDSGEPVSTLPLKQIAALEDGDAQRYAKRRGLEWPDTDDARMALRNEIHRSMRAGQSVVIDAPTSLGKSFMTATEPWLRRTNITGDAPVAHFSATCDARDDAVADSRDAGRSYAVLKGRTERCPCARGDHDPNPDGEDPDVVLTVDGEPVSEWIDRQCGEKGLPFQVAHAYAAAHNDQDRDLPCCEGDAECPAVTQWEGVPRDDDGNPSVDVVHATNKFAYVPGLRRGCNTVVDELPDYTADLTQDRVRRMVIAFLDEVDAPVSTFEAFISLANHDGYGGDAAAEREATDAALDRSPDREWYLTNPDAHALAPDITRCVWRAIKHEDLDANGRRTWTLLHEPPRFDDEANEGYGGNWLTVVLDDKNTIQTVRHVPDFSAARSVIGLDAHPSMSLWQRNVKPDLERVRVLDPDERHLWRRFERGLTVVQVGDATRPLSGGNAREWFDNDAKLDAILERLREHHGTEFGTAITTAQVEPAMQKRMSEAGVREPETMHYGEEKSRNDFAGESIGLVNGCMDPGDDYVLDLLAELDLEAHPAPARDEDGEIITDDNDAPIREKGRAFVGPDADTAAELLASVRENHVAQGAGRYARDPDDPENSAVVFVRTDAMPAGFADLQANGVEWASTDLQRQILETLQTCPRATTREIADAVDASKEHVRKTLRRAGANDIVDCWTSAGDHGADLYAARSERVDVVDLAEGETTNPCLENPIRWALAIRDADERDTVPAAGRDGQDTRRPGVWNRHDMTDPGD